MKIAKIIIGILGIIHAVRIAVMANDERIAELAEGATKINGIGFVFCLFLLVASLIGIFTTKKTSGGVIAGAIYIFGGLFGFSFNGFAGIVSIIFGIIYIAGSRDKKAKAMSSPDSLQ